MGYDINFWKLSPGALLDPTNVYQRLCEGAEVSGLETLAVDQILNRLKEILPKFDPSESFPLVKLPEGSTIEVSWSKQHFRFDGRGDAEAAFRHVMSMMREFNCLMFDPQEEKIYETDDPIPFEDPQEGELFRQKLRSEEDVGRRMGKTCLEVGPYRIFFFLGIAREPAHFYAQRERHVAKFWLDPLKLAWNRGLGLGWIDHVLEIAEERYDELTMAWETYKNAQ